MVQASWGEGQPSARSESLPGGLLGQGAERPEAFLGRKGWGMTRGPLCRALKGRSQEAVVPRPQGGHCPGGPGPTGAERKGQPALHSGPGMTPLAEWNTHHHWRMVVSAPVGSPLDAPSPWHVHPLQARPLLGHPEGSGELEQDTAPCCRPWWRNWQCSVGQGKGGGWSQRPPGCLLWASAWPSPRRLLWPAGQPAHPWQLPPPAHGAPAVALEVPAGRPRSSHP